jgi:FixJ family two-component response regulator
LASLNAQRLLVLNFYDVQDCMTGGEFLIDKRHYCGGVVLADYLLLETGVELREQLAKEGQTFLLC